MSVLFQSLLGSFSGELWGKPYLVLAVSRLTYYSPLDGSVSRFRFGGPELSEMCWAGLVFLARQSHRETACLFKT